MAATEDLHASASTNLVMREQTSTTTTTYGSSDDKFTSKEKRWFRSVMDPEVSEHPPPMAKISRVDGNILPRTFNFKEHFLPRRISVGLHHRHSVSNGDQLHRIEELKPQWAKRFIEDSMQQIESLYKKIFMEISQLKQCYYQLNLLELSPVFRHNCCDTYCYCNSDTVLAKAMLLDGCSVLCFIHYIMEGKFGKLNIDYTSADYIIQDLFLLENQLPFRVLVLLLEESNKNIKATIMRAIETLISRITYSEPGPEHALRGSKEGKDPHQPFHLLDLLRTRLLGGTSTDAQEENNGGSGGGDFLHCRNVKVLKAARIQFRPSKTNKLTDVSFISRGINGYLYLPPLTIDRSTVTLLWNLIAYEMCPNITTPDSGTGVTSYVTFLDSLIDYSEDVEELESARVLQNSLGSSADVARFFNSISANLAARYIGFDPQVIAGIKAHVAKHDTHRTYIWTSQLLDGYFSSPWKFIALVAAVLVVFLTAVQTYFAVFPHRFE